MFDDEDILPIMQILKESRFIDVKNEGRIPSFIILIVVIVVISYSHSTIWVEYPFNMHISNSESCKHFCHVIISSYPKQSSSLCMVIEF